MLSLVVAMALQPGKFAARAQDWTLGPVIYQVFVDRFSRGIETAKKRSSYPGPLKPWSELPRSGRPDPAKGVWSHELDFWGGDLPGIRSKLDYVKSIGADVLYMTPIFKALTNHKYDAQDYLQIDPQFGTMADLESLIHDAHAKKMRIMLDGVFNHMGKTAPIFQEALRSPASTYRNWFFFDKSGYRGWFGVPNLPALRIENPAVRRYLWSGPSSVVKTYLDKGIDGWRLDVAFELGPKVLEQITHAAHGAKPGSVVVGELSGYPADWFPSVDGVFNFYALRVADQMLRGEISPSVASRMLQAMVDDAGTENLLRSWLLIDNHDTERATTVEPDEQLRRLLFALQFSLPGAPVIYYGTELGLEGQGDPTNRSPMPWDRLPGNPTLAWIKKLTAFRRAHPALRYGDLKILPSEKLFGFARVTDKVSQAVIVLVNPTDHEVRETVPSRVGKIMSWGALKDAFSGKTITSVNGLLEASVPARSVMFLTPIVGGANSPYKRTP